MNYIRQDSPVVRQESPLVREQSIRNEEEKMEGEKFLSLMAEQDIVQLKAREEEARIMTELPTLKVSHIDAAWESEVCLG